MVQINPSAVVEYSNNANLYITVPEDFFTELGHIVPGDSVTEEITIGIFFVMFATA